MKLYIYILVTLFIIASTTSCRKSYLDVEDNSVILREQYVTNIKTLQEYLNGVYISLAKDFYNGSSGHQIYSELIADNIKPSSTNTSTFLPHYFWNQSTAGSANNMNTIWKNGYQIIRSCNFAIEKSEEYKKDDVVTASQISGEAYAVRALVHFVLVNIFAQSYSFSPTGNHPGIPYITSWDWNDPILRNTVSEVYERLISDLNIAIAQLQPGASNKLIMNQLAAKALLARIYLFKEDWQKAKSIAIEVTKAVPLLDAASFPAKLFTKDETEAIFQLTPSSTNVISGSYTTTFAGFYFRSTAFLATKDIADLLKQNINDSRNKWISSSGLAKDSIRKYPINVIAGFGTGTNPGRSYYLTLFRSSEMFLTVAESAAKNGDEDIARTYLDAIRLRANPTSINSTATGTALLDSIYLERRKELSFEGFRMWDLLRWKQIIKRTDVITGAPTILLYPNDKAIAPIPLPDVNFGLPQNATYTADKASPMDSISTNNIIQKKQNTIKKLP